MDFSDVLFRRILVNAYRNDRDEDKNLPPEEVIVTQERNGYALWFQGGRAWPWPRVIGWTFASGKYDLLAYAATIKVELARHNAEEGYVEYAIPRLDKMARDPIVVPEAP